MATTPGTHPLIYMSLLAGGASSPGTVKLKGHNRKDEWEVKRPKGQTGAHTVKHGEEPCRFTATFFLATPEQVEAWDGFQRHLDSTRQGPKPQAMSVYHPDLARNRITDCIVEEIGGFEHDGKNGATVSVTFLEYRPAKPKASSKPGASRTGSTTIDTAGTRVDPNAAAKRELAALIEQAKAP